MYMKGYMTFKYVLLYMSNTSYSGTLVELVLTLPRSITKKLVARD
jgi:hypothetical protein